MDDATQTESPPQEPMTSEGFAEKLGSKIAELDSGGGEPVERGDTPVTGEELAEEPTPTPPAPPPPPQPQEPVDALEQLRRSEQPQQQDEPQVPLDDDTMEQRISAVLTKQGIDPEKASPTERSLAQSIVHSQWLIGNQGNQLGEERRAREELERRMSLLEDQAFSDDDDEGYALDDDEWNDLMGEKQDYARAAIAAASVGDWDRAEEALAELDQINPTESRRISSAITEAKILARVQPTLDRDQAQAQSSQRQEIFSQAWKNVAGVAPDIGQHADGITQIIQSRPHLLLAMQANPSVEAAQDVLITAYQAAKHMAAGRTTEAAEIVQRQEAENVEAEKQKATVASGGGNAPSSKPSDWGDRFKEGLKEQFEAENPGRAW